MFRGVWGLVGCLPAAAVSTCESAFRVAGLGLCGVQSVKCGV